MYVYIALVVIVISSKDNSNVVTEQIYANMYGRCCFAFQYT